MTSFLYRLALSGARFMSPLLERGDGKLARGLAGRRDAHEVLATWGDHVRDPARPVAWFHAPSVGEGLQAQAVIEALRLLEPGVQIVYTYFSPSAEDLARHMGADVAAYLPWDLPGPVVRALDAVRPDILAFTKTEVWPVLVAEARVRGAKVGIVGGSVPDGAGRLRWPVRSGLRPTWNRLAFAGAIAPTDAERLLRLGVPPASVLTTGDPAVDSAASRFASADPEAPWLAPFHRDPRPTLVAGSTWPTDEAVLLPALHSARRRVPELRAIIAPHEPDTTLVELLVGELRADGWAPTTLSAVERAGSLGDAGAIVVDRVGVLAQLYAVADVSFVGGGFHPAGLHSVLEPAAAGVPVVFGPRHHNAQAAADLLEAGGAKIARNADGLTDVLTEWLQDPMAGKDVGRFAQDYIHSHLGAASRSAEMLAHLMKALE